MVYTVTVPRAGLRLSCMSVFVFMCLLFDCLFVVFVGSTEMRVEWR